jgi:orotate phosphoribosyltransferase-like protein
VVQEGRDPFVRAETKGMDLREMTDELKVLKTTALHLEKWTVVAASNPEISDWVLLIGHLSRNRLTSIHTSPSAVILEACKVYFLTVFLSAFSVFHTPPVLLEGAEFGPATGTIF